MCTLGNDWEREVEQTNDFTFNSRLVRITSLSIEDSGGALVLRTKLSLRVSHTMHVLPAKVLK